MSAGATVDQTDGAIIEMKVTQVAIIPTEASVNAGRPSLTPELLAASGARYSRNNEGLETILARIDPKNLDKSVDGIFKMIDYGHQSIADMVPVAMFMDNISIWLAYYLWSLCPTAGGQESSTRYIQLSQESLVAGEYLGGGNLSAWHNFMQSCFTAYEEALALWEELFEKDPRLARIPSKLLNDSSDKAAKQIARMRRNYSFDRARYFLPVAARTNVMMIMSARGWVQLCQNLLSHPLSEAKRLGQLISDELNLVAPRLLRHATAKDSIIMGIKSQFDTLVEKARAQSEQFLLHQEHHPESPATAHLEIYEPADVTAGDITDALAFHDNRYAWIAESLARTMVRFSWDAVAIAEIRDLNRHRTGTKHCPLIPRGFYYAADQVPSDAASMLARLKQLAAIGAEATKLSWQHLTKGDPSYIYWTVLGTQYPFEHLTTADKFIYEAELRTGTGAHFRYAQHLKDSLALWYKKFPETAKCILEGSAEPE